MTTKDASLPISDSAFTPDNQPLEALTVAELNELAVAEGIDLLGVKKKADIIELITAHRIALAEAGDSTGDDGVADKAVSEPVPAADNSDQAAAQGDDAVDASEEQLAVDALAPDVEEAGVIQVRSRAEQGRWRAGKFFTREPVTLELAKLTPDELAALKADPMLVVVEAG